MTNIQFLGNIYGFGQSFAGAVFDTNGLCPTINTCGGGNREPLILEEKIVCEEWCDEGLRFFSNNTVGTIRTIESGGDKRVIEQERTNTYRIRKLTPKECYLLMGFDATDFEKAEKVNSNSQLYKQAGNSIVVNVLEEIFKQML
mgnify:CR=1 FL=1